MKRRRRRRRGVARRRGAAPVTGGGSAGGPARDAGRGAGAAVEFEDGGTVDAIAASIRAGGIPRASPRNGGGSSCAVDDGGGSDGAGGGEDSGAAGDGDGSGAGGDGGSRGAAGDGESSRVGGDLFAARIRGLIDMQREVRTLAAAWAESREPGAEDHRARFAIETLRSMVLRKMAELSGRAEPASLDELDCLSRTLQRIEVADRYRRERTQAPAEAESAAHPAERKPPPSPEELRAMIYPAVMERFHPGRLGSKPWEPWPDAPAPAEADGNGPETSPDPGAGHFAWDGPEPQSEQEARGAHGSEEAGGSEEEGEARDPDGPGAAHDRDGAREAEDTDRAREFRARRAHEAGRTRGAHDSARLGNPGGAGGSWAGLSGFY